MRPLRCSRHVISLIAAISLTGLSPLSGATPASSSSGAKDARDFEGVWRRISGPGDSSDFFIANDLPYRPEAEEIATRHRKLFADGHTAASAHLTCRPTGVQGVTAPKEAVLFLQTPKKLIMISQEDREVRRVYMNQTHPKNLRPTYSGNSIARWQGNTLVIDTIGYNGKGQLDEVGNPHSNQLHVVEQWTKSEDGNVLNASYTFTDPVYYTQPFTVTRQFRRTPGVHLLDYDCAENPRSDDFSNLTFEHDWFKPTCILPIVNGVAADKVVCTPRT